MSTKYVMFEFNRENCAIDISEILEITTLESLYKVESGEISIADWNGQAIPVIDPYSLLTLREHNPTINSRIAVIENNDLKYGILFDAAKGALEINEDDIQEPMLNEGRYIKGVTENNIKIFDTTSMLRKNIVEMFDHVYGLNVSVFNDAIHYYEKEDMLQGELLELAKIKMLNLLVKASKEELSEEYLNGILEIQQLINSAK